MVRDLSETREQILLSAKQRFASIGYTKTTMAELAEDCALSTAHLYNFYKNKLDIAGELVEQEMLQMAETLSKLLDPEQSADQILPLYFCSELNAHLSLRQDNPGMPGLLSLVRRKLPLVAKGFDRRFRKDLSLYLNARMKCGDIRRQDPFRLSETLYNGTTQYRLLESMTEATETVLENQIRDIVTLFLSGLTSKNSSALV